MRDGLRIGAIGILAAALVTLVAHLTRERAERNATGAMATVLRTLLPEGSYDNHPEEDRILVLDPELGTTLPVPVFRARLAGRPVAAVVTATAPQGYAGPITLLVAIGVDGAVLGVQLREHRETPGIGDRIEPGKSTWLASLSGRTLVPDGTSRPFDALTGATVSSRAVANAVDGSLRYFEAHRAEIFAPAAP